MSLMLTAQKQKFYIKFGLTLYSPTFLVYYEFSSIKIFSIRTYNILMKIKLPQNLSFLIFNKPVGKFDDNPLQKG